TFFPVNGPALGALADAVGHLIAGAVGKAVFCQLGQALPAGTGMLAAMHGVQQLLPDRAIAALFGGFFGRINVTAHPGPAHILGRFNPDGVACLDDGIRRGITDHFQRPELLRHSSFPSDYGRLAVWSGPRFLRSSANKFAIPMPYRRRPGNSRTACARAPGSRRAREGT